MRNRRIAFLAAVVFVAFNAAIGWAEYTRVHADTLYLELAPRDPRSLMQGDYMRLDFAVARRIDRSRSENASSGTVVVVLDDERVARFDHLGSTPHGPSERVIRWRRKGGRVVVGTDAFHFQEGRAKHFERARYGEFRVAESGHAILIGLRDADLERL